MRLPIIDKIQSNDLSSLIAITINNKTKPPGSLGMLEMLAHQIGLIQKTVQPQLNKPCIFVFAADHGVVEERISAYPQNVTWQMMENFLAEGAAINVFARQNGCELKIVDAGVNHDFGSREGLIDRKIALGTRNFAKVAAMSQEQCAMAIEYGKALIESHHGNVVGFGDMGIGNTTAAAAIMHKLTGLALDECVGAGAGLTSDGVRHKQFVIASAVAAHNSATEPMDILATFGGFEIAMMAGAMLESARSRKLLLIDGFIVTSALLFAARLQPAILDYCVFTHCSDEHGHRRMLQYLNARPLLHLDLRLGEGTGCALAWPLVQAAVNMIRDMATFDSAAVSQKSA